MKELIIVYKDYVLEVEINKEYSYIKGICKPISFENSGHISVTISPITALFIENVNQIIKNKEDKFVNFSGPSDVELRLVYKGKTLYIGSYDLDKKIVDITKTNFGLKSGTSDKLDELVEQFMQYTDKEEQMSFSTFHKYNDFTLELKKVETYYIGRCDSAGFYKEAQSVPFLIGRFESFIDDKEKDFEYKGYTLKLGVVEIKKGGYCKELNYKTYGDDEEANITKFKKYINWKITSDKKEDTSHTHLLTQLDRLAKKDKEDNFTPFELRGQLIEIYHLFGKILSLTVQDINKLYFERPEG